MSEYAYDGDAGELDSADDFSEAEPAAPATHERDVVERFFPRSDDGSQVDDGGERVSRETDLVARHVGLHNDVAALNRAGEILSQEYQQADAGEDPDAVEDTSYIDELFADDEYADDAGEYEPEPTSLEEQVAQRVDQLIDHNNQQLAALEQDRAEWAEMMSGRAQQRQAEALAAGQAHAEQLAQAAIARADSRSDPAAVVEMGNRLIAGVDPVALAELSDYQKQQFAAAVLADATERVHHDAITDSVMRRVFGRRFPR